MLFCSCSVSASRLRVEKGSGKDPEKEIVQEMAAGKRSEKEIVHVYAQPDVLDEEVEKGSGKGSEKEIRCRPMRNLCRSKPWYAVVYCSLEKGSGKGSEPWYAVVCCSLEKGFGKESEKEIRCRPMRNLCRSKPWYAVVC